MKTTPSSSESKKISSQEGWVRLSDESMQPAMQELTRRITTEKGFARRLLFDAGIVDKNGKLKRKFA